MWKKNFLSFIFILLLCPLSVQAEGFSAMYVLGDSLSDQGDLFAATSALTDGMFGLPDADHYFQGRFSNGYNYVDWLSEKLKLNVVSSLEGGTNFSYGGAFSDGNLAQFDLAQYLGLIFNEPPFPWSLYLQRLEFVSRGIDDPNALYVVFNGANDVTKHLLFSEGTNFDEEAKGIIDTIDAFVGAGARDILVALVPDLGMTPGAFFGGYAAPATMLSEALNDKIKEKLAEYYTVMDDTGEYYTVMREYYTVNIMVFNSFEVLHEIVEHPPSAYNFEDFITPCYSASIYPEGLDKFIYPYPDYPEDYHPERIECDNPDSYFFWDTIHPTKAGHRLLSDLMLQRVIEGILSDFINELTQFEGLPKSSQKIFLKNLSKIEILLTDEYQANDLFAINSLRALATALENLGDSPLVQVDTTDLSHRASQIAELAEANLR